MVIVGIDEVGRGCWAGPLVAGAVVLGDSIGGLKDSKQLSRKQRERLARDILLQALDIGLGWVDAATIDEIGLSAAVGLAMSRALAAISVPHERIIIDGNINFLPANPKVQTLIKADASVPAVSAASIVAKVARDEYMARAAKQFPGYGFEEHVGYGTALHRAQLSRLGLCELHRRSFKPIKALLA
jgi:ribonuclease HII